MVIDQNIDTSTPTGKLMFNMLASIAEFETEIRKERQMEGIAKALDKGVKFGRKSKLTTEQINTMKEERETGLRISELMSKYSLSKVRHLFTDICKWLVLIGDACVTN